MWRKDTLWHWAGSVLLVLGGAAGMAVLWFWWWGAALFALVAAVLAVAFVGIGFGLTSLTYAIARDQHPTRVPEDASFTPGPSPTR